MPIFFYIFSRFYGFYCYNKNDMISVSTRILLHDNSDKTPPVIVDKIPGDEVCIISFGGGGILNYENANKLARIIFN